LSVSGGGGGGGGGGKDHWGGISASPTGRENWLSLGGKKGEKGKVLKKKLYNSRKGKGGREGNSRGPFGEKGSSKEEESLQKWGDLETSLKKGGKAEGFCGEEAPKSKGPSVERNALGRGRGGENK